MTQDFKKIVAGMSVSEKREFYKFLADSNQEALVELKAKAIADIQKIHDDATNEGVSITFADLTNFMESGFTSLAKKGTRKVKPAGEKTDNEIPRSVYRHEGKDYEVRRGTKYTELAGLTKEQLKAIKVPNPKHPDSPEYKAEKAPAETGKPPVHTPETAKPAEEKKSAGAKK